MAEGVTHGAPTLWLPHQLHLRLQLCLRLDHFDHLPRYPRHRRPTGKNSWPKVWQSQIRFLWTTQNVTSSLSLIAQGTILQNNFSTRSLVIPSCQGDSLIFHNENFLQLMGVLLTHPPLSLSKEIAHTTYIKSCSPSKVAKEWRNIPLHLLERELLKCKPWF